MHDRRFRFGVHSSAPASARDWTELARQAEGLGYDILTMADHLVDHMSIGPALATAAAATTTLRVGSVVHCNDFRHPVMLAKELATIDLLSDGRLEFGLGAGWMTSEYEAMGINLDPAPIRLDRLEESVAIIGGLMRGDVVEHRGHHYTVNQVSLSPQPVQTAPPMMLGGGGKRMLSIAARHGDIVGINFSLGAGAISAGVGADGTAERTDRKLAWVRAAAGDRYDTIEIQSRVHHTTVTSDRESGTTAAQSLGFTHDEALASPHVLVGTTDQIIELLTERRERWDMSYITVNATSIADFAPVVAALSGS